jgi:hypothetical protein
MSRLPSSPKASLRRLVLGILTGALLLGVTGMAGAEELGAGRLGLASNPSHPHAEDHVLVRFDPRDAGISTLGRGVEGLGRGWFQVPVPPGWEPIDWAVHLTSRPGVELAELDVLLETLAVPVPLTSNDPLYTSGSGNPSAQWHLHSANVGPAWQTTVGNGVAVAVIDTGVTEGSDGFCEPFIAPRNVVTGTSGEAAAADIDGHGSHVAGSVAQCTGNGIGGAGMAPGARIMPIQAFEDVGFSVAHVAQGIDWARENGAAVINLSLGCTGDCPESSMLNSAIEQAEAAGILMVAASGNTGGAVHYPASHPAVMAVGASTITGAVASYSARGSGLDLVAPGGDSSAPVWQETLGSYRGASGTSMAAAHVSGAAALLRSQFPTASAAQVRNALTCSATDLSPGGWDSDSGFGSLNAGAAVEQLLQMMGAGAWDCVGQASSSAAYAAIQTNAGFWRLYHGPTQVAAFYYGVPGDYGFMGDWDCDGIDTPGLYRQSDGYVYLRNSNTQGVADISFFFGNPGDVPLAGDFDGDGCDTVSIYRPSEARFYIINSLGSADTGLGAAEYSYLFGNPGDKPFMGDWNGDGVDTPGLRRDSNGFVYLRDSNTQGVGEIEYFYGNNGDVVFAGDWDGDGDDTLGLYRPSNGTVYLRNTNSTGIADFSFFVGSGMQPAGGDF